MRLGQRAAEHSEVLAEDVDRATVDRAATRHHAVTRNLNASKNPEIRSVVQQKQAAHSLLVHVEVVAAVLDEHVHLRERTRIQQKIDALARCQLFACMRRMVRNR